MLSTNLTQLRFSASFFSSRDHTAGADSMCVARRTAATARALTLRTLTILTVEYIGVSINGRSPKWMVYNGKSIYKWMIWGVPPF